MIKIAVDAMGGDYAPFEQVKGSVWVQLAAVALTDHDTVTGLEEFQSAALEHPECEAVPGVELACMLYMREVHIVGLFIDRHSPVLNDFLEKCRIERAKRNRDIFLKLHFLGYAPKCWSANRKTARNSRLPTPTTAEPM